MNISNFVSADVILASIYRDLKRTDLSTSDIIEWIGEALGGIGVLTQYEPAIRFLEVKNFSCKKPDYMQMLIQIARNNSYDECPIVPKDLVVTEGSTVIAADGTSIQNYDAVSYKPYFEILGEFVIGGIVTAKHKNQFTPVRLSNHTFFNTLVCKEEDWENIYRNCNDEYTIVDDRIKFSFPTGQVAISYLKVKLDCNGYPMIPDHYSVITAVTKYVIMKLMAIDFYNHRQGAENAMMKSEQDWQWYCKQASNQLMIPYGIDEWENLLRQRNYLIPRIDRYDNFFGNLSSTENRKFLQR